MKMPKLIPGKMNVILTKVAAGHAEGAKPYVYKPKSSVTVKKVSPVIRRDFSIGLVGLKERG